MRSAAEWPTVAELQRDGILRVEDGNHGEYRPRPDEFGSGVTAFIRASDMDGGRVLFDSASKINDVALRRIQKGLGKPGDILFSSKGTVGKLARAPMDSPPFVCSPQTTYWRVLDTDRLSRGFLYTYMRSRGFCEQWEAIKGETDMADYASLTAQRRFRVPLPGIDFQRWVESHITALDDKIELNRRMNRTLEALAGALFRAWFVDFEPVVAKAAGRAPAHLSPEIAALFPASFVESPLEAIPQGWSVCRLAELTTKIGSGSTPRGGSAVYVDDGPALIRSQNVHDCEFDWSGLARLTAESANALRSVEVKVDDVLLNITGDSILRTCVVDPAVLPAHVNQHVAIIRGAAGVPGHFLQLYLVQPRLKETMLGFDAGGTRAAVTKGQLESVEIIRPSAEILDAFEEVTDPLFAKAEANRQESRTLAALRDTLLPKLLSGEIRVSAAEKLAASHA